MAVARDSDVAFVFVFVEEIIVEVIEPEEGCLGELGKFASFFLSGASKSFLTIDEAAYFHHFKQFELVAAGDIFQNTPPRQSRRLEMPQSLQSRRSSSRRSFASTVNRRGH